MARPNSNNKTLQKSQKRKKNAKSSDLECNQNFKDYVQSHPKLAKAHVWSEQLKELEEATTQMTAFRSAQASDNLSPEMASVPTLLRRLEPSWNMALNNTAPSAVTTIQFPVNVPQPVPSQRPAFLYCQSDDSYYLPSQEPIMLTNNIERALFRKPPKENFLNIWQFNKMQLKWKNLFSLENVKPTSIFENRLPWVDKFTSAKAALRTISGSLTNNGMPRQEIEIFFSSLSPAEWLVFNCDTCTLSSSGMKMPTSSSVLIPPSFKQTSLTRLSASEDIFVGRVSLEAKSPLDGVYLRKRVCSTKDTGKTYWRRLATTREPVFFGDPISPFPSTNDFTWPLDHISWVRGNFFYIIGGSTAVSKEKAKRDYPNREQVKSLNEVIVINLSTGHLVSEDAPLTAQGEAQIPCPRFGSATAESVDGRTLYVIGGQNENGNLLNDIWALDKDFHMWTRLPFSLPLGLVLASAAFDSRANQLMIVGGWCSDVLEDENDGDEDDDDDLPRRVNNLNIFQSKVTVLSPFMFQVQLPLKDFSLLQQLSLKAYHKALLNVLWSDFYKQVQADANEGRKSGSPRLHCLLMRLFNSQENMDNDLVKMAHFLGRQFQTVKRMKLAQIEMLKTNSNAIQQ